MKKISKSFNNYKNKNEERWLEQCLKKIFNQSYSNFEVLLLITPKDRTIKKQKNFRENLKSKIFYRKSN